MKYWRLDYYRRHNWIDTKYIKDEFSQGAIKKARVKNIVDLQEITEAEYKAGLARRIAPQCGKEKHMKKTYADGWHKVGGYDCWIKSGTVRHATMGEGYDYRTAYPYRRSGSGWSIAIGVKPDTLRRGLARGTYSIQ